MKKLKFNIAVFHPTGISINNTKLTEKITKTDNIEMKLVNFEIYCHFFVNNLQKS